MAAGVRPRGHCRACGAPPKASRELHCQDLLVRTETVAATPDNHPVLLRHRFGAGSVCLSTPGHTQEGWAKQEHTLAFFRALLKGPAAEGYSPDRRSGAQN